ncbi:hypothetical protein GJ744_011510 [Endocarpon pusillum]|uniref:Uncharacterized protein n=1 Tax=Endocarpon pusillum TaxID=364733 RepID=A0A8H7E4S9_9EURO|nr:hypothetical protein GJ744_011510 [Endocarpon pusillum]
MSKDRATSKLQDPSLAAHNGKSSPPPPWSQGRALRPSDILELQKETRSHLESLKASSLDPRPDLRNNPCQATSEPNKKDSAKYVIPQKRVSQLRSLEPTAITSAQHPSGLSAAPFKLKSCREKVVGGLSKEDELQAIWKKFDEEEGRQRFRPAAEGEADNVSGNEVLGAWEEDHALHDLYQEDGPP